MPHCRGPKVPMPKSGTFRQQAHPAQDTLSPRPSGARRPAEAGICCSDPRLDEALAIDRPSEGEHRPSMVENASLGQGVA
jgi:hypothetical protein